MRSAQQFATNGKQKGIIMKELLELLEKYSKFLEEYGYTDSDWREEKPTAIHRFLSNENKSFPVELPVKPACVNCKYVYNDKDIEQILYCRNPKFAEYINVVFGGCDGSISVNENFGCIDFESKSV